MLCLSSLVSDKMASTVYLISFNNGWLNGDFYLKLLDANGGVISTETVESSSCEPCVNFGIKNDGTQNLNIYFKGYYADGSSSNTNANSDGDLLFKFQYTADKIIFNYWYGPMTTGKWKTITYTVYNGDTINLGFVDMVYGMKEDHQVTCSSMSVVIGHDAWVTNNIWDYCKLVGRVNYTF